MASLTTYQALALLQDTSLSDYTIKCDKHSFPVHKAVLCHKSEFFAACIKNDHFEESQKSTLVIRESSPLAVAVLLISIYTKRVSVTDAYKVWPQLPKTSVKISKVNDHYRQILADASIYLGAYQLAARYMLDDLKVRIRDRVMSSLEIDRHTCVHHAPYLRAIVDAILTHTNEGDILIRAPFMRQIVEKSKPEYWDEEEEKAWRDVLSVLIEHEPVAFEMGVAMEKKKKD